MNNVLNYYYQLYPTNIHQNDKIFSFEIDSILYNLSPIMLDYQKTQELYSLSNQLIQFQIFVHQIVPNINNELITTVNNIPYILTKQFQTSKEPIDLLDLLRFQEQTSFVIHQNKKINWKNLWSSKIDYFEYQINQFGKKLPIIRKSCSYYIGLAEMAISLLNFVDSENTPYHLVLSHQRITHKTTFADLFNSLQFVIDSKTRDIAEYFKDKFIHNFYIMDELNDFFNQNLNSNEYLLFFSRMLFPSYYFDYFEMIIRGDKPEKEILKIIEKNKDFEELLVEIYYTIQQYVRLPEIDWFKFYGKF